MKYLVAVSMVVAAIMLYGCGYCLMLRGRYVVFTAQQDVGPEEPLYRFVGPDVPSRDRLAGKIVTAFFAPANAIDKQLRSRAWKGPQMMGVRSEQPTDPTDVSPNPM